MKYDTLDGDGTFRMYSSTCSHCAHLQCNWKRQCKAFPIRIPDEIWEGRNNHTEPYPGDFGIRFERRIPVKKTNE